MLIIAWCYWSLHSHARRILAAAAVLEETSLGCSPCHDLFCVVVSTLWHFVQVLGEVLASTDRKSLLSESSQCQAASTFVAFYSIVNANIFVPLRHQHG